jgi:hypothetical protein
MIASSSFVDPGPAASYVAMPTLSNDITLGTKPAHARLERHRVQSLETLDLTIDYAYQQRS